MPFAVSVIPFLGVEQELAKHLTRTTGASLHPGLVFRLTLHIEIPADVISYIRKNSLEMIKVSIFFH